MLTKHTTLSNYLDMARVIEWEKTKVESDLQGNWVDSNDTSEDREHRKGRGFGGPVMSEVLRDSQAVMQGGWVEAELSRVCWWGRTGGVWNSLK